MPVVRYRTLTPEVRSVTGLVSRRALWRNCAALCAGRPFRLVPRLGVILRLRIVLTSTTSNAVVGGRTATMSH